MFGKKMINFSEIEEVLSKAGGPLTSGEIMKRLSNHFGTEETEEERDAFHKELDALFGIGAINCHKRDYFNTKYSITEREDKRYNKEKITNKLRDLSWVSIKSLAEALDIPKSGRNELERKLDHLFDKGIVDRRNNEDTWKSWEYRLKDKNS